MFSSAFQALLFVEFNFVLNSLSSNSCLIVDQRKFLLSSWPYLIWEIFALNRQTFAFFIHCFHRYFYQTELDMQWRQIDFQFIPWSRMCCILLTWCFWMEWRFLYSVVAVPCSAVPFTLKAAEISISTMQPSQHCCNFEVDTYIPPVFFICTFAAKPEGSCTFLSRELHEPVG